MKIEEGKFYRSSAGEKVGPMRDPLRAGVFVSASHPKMLWSVYGIAGEDGHNIVAEWVDEPAAPPHGPRHTIEVAMAAAMEPPAADPALDWSKPLVWRYDSGSEVDIVAWFKNEDGNTRFVVLKVPGGHVGEYVEVNGKNLGSQSRRVLFNKVERRSLWANVYVDGISSDFSSRENAGSGAGSRRKALLEIQYEDSKPVAAKLHEV